MLNAIGQTSTSDTGVRGISSTPSMSPADVAAHAAASHVRSTPPPSAAPAYEVAIPYLSPVGDGALSRLSAEFRAELAGAA